MKKLFAIAAMALLPFTAVADDMVELAASAGISKVDGFDNGQAYTARVGYQWSDYLTPELGYTKVKFDQEFDDVTVQGKAKAWSVGVALHTNKHNPVYAGVRGGRYWAKGKVSAMGYAESDSFRDWTYGAFAGWNLSESFALTAEYTRYHEYEDIDVVGVGFQYEF